MPTDRKTLDANYYRVFTNVLQDNNGLFEIRGVPPGSYDLYAMLSLTVFPRGARDGLYGRTHIEVRNENIENLEVVVPPNVDVAGRVVVEGDVKGVDLQKLRMEFGLEYLAAPITARVAADGTFNLPQMAPYNYRPALTGLTGSAYVDDILQNGRSIYDAGLTVERNAPPLRVVVKTTGLTVQGKVATKPNQSAANATVVLVPQQRRENLSLYKTAIAGSDGGFSIPGVAPGAYKVFAWEDVPAFAYQNAEFMSAYENRGQVLTAVSGGVLNVNPSLIPRD